MVKLLMIILFGNYTLCANFLGEHQTGWWWYRDPPVDMPEDQKIDKKDNQNGSQGMTAKQKQEAYGEELANRLAEAWLNPTPKNVQNYQVMQQDMMERSNQFANTWMSNIFTNPDLDHTLRAPVNQKAIHIKADEDTARKHHTIAELADQFGLFFFFGGECQYCHQFAPIVKAFGQKHNWQVMAISIDGKALEAFPKAELDNGLFETWNLKALPVVVAVNPTTGEAIPIAQGMISLSDMEDRIMMILKTREANV